MVVHVKTFFVIILMIQLNVMTL